MYGAFQAFSATVETMVIGGYQYIESGIMNSGQIFIGSAESGIAFVRFSSESNFQISYGKVSTLDFVFDIFKIAGIIVASCRSTCSVNLSLMLHEVTCKKKRKGVCLQTVSCQYLCGSIIFLRFADTRELCNQEKGY